MPRANRPPPGNDFPPPYGGGYRGLLAKEQDFRRLTPAATIRPMLHAPCSMLHAGLGTHGP